ncbi:MAG TPA: hypothetical protein VNY06_06670 [Methylocella sp.]|nr:hypothetical protein [Methylocella sp.]
MADAAFDFGSRQSRSGKDRFFAKRTQFVVRTKEGHLGVGGVESIVRMAMAPVFGEKKKLANSLVHLLTGGTQHRRHLEISGI